MTTPAMVTFVLPSFAGGGAERVILTVAAALDRNVISPRLVVLDGRGPLRDLLPGDVPVMDLGQPRLRRALPALWWELKRQRPQVVLSTLGYLNLGLLMLRLLLPRSIRYVVREANLPDRGGDQPAGRIAALGYRRLYPRAEIVLCPALRVADSLRDQFDAPAAKLKVVYNPVDESMVRQRAASCARKPGPGLRLVASGRLTRQKGFDRLIEMFRRAPDTAHLTILGEGEDRTSLEGLAERHGLAGRIDFPGYRENPWAYYAGADAFLLPSRWEGLPNAALESLACGTPVIATPEAGGIDEIAEAAQEGAVSLAEAGNPFLGAINALRPAPVAALRPSLLPAPFRHETVIGQYQALLESLVRT